MATYTKVLLSGSTNGKVINITGTASGSANTIHTAVSGTSSLDEVWLYAHNTHTADVELTIEWGETTASNVIKVTVPYKQGKMIVVSGELLQNGLGIKAFAATTAVVNISGFVNRIV